MSAPIRRDRSVTSQHLRVASVPAAHRYVEHAVAGAGIELVADEPTLGRPAGPWCPSPVLDPEWMTAHHADLDLVHVHFGFESRTPEQLSDWADRLASWHIPLVVTVHDLQLPHDRDHAMHHQRLGALLSRAAAVITLTRGAAGEIAHRFGRRAHVVPHPRMAPLHLIRDTVRTPADRVRVGVHLKSLRPNGPTSAWLLGVVDAVRQCAGAGELIVHVHREIRDPGFARYDARMLAVLDQLSGSGRATVRWVDRMTDPQLWSYLHSIDVSVLPHRWGTHSGWLEECLDLAVVPVVPRIGYLSEQFGRHLYGWSSAGPDSRSLLAAVRTAVEEAAAGRSPVDSHAWAAHRERTDAAIHETHRAVYREVLAA